jgi:hypothetical protein
MRIEAEQARTRIVRLVERIAVLEATLEQCRALAEKAAPTTAEHYCRQIEQVASVALDQAVV